MEKYKDKDNNQLSVLLNEIKTEHENLKKEMLRGCDRMDELEKTFGEINTTIIKRLKGDKNG